MFKKIDPYKPIKTVFTLSVMYGETDKSNRKDLKETQFKRGEIEVTLF